MLKRFKFKLLNMFREFLVYHSSSLEFRAELIVLMIMSNDKVDKCEEEIVMRVSKEIYSEDEDRAALLQETIHELHEKIVVNNGLDYTDLITKISNDIKHTPRFAQKINPAHLKEFKKCLSDEEEMIFHDRIVDYLSSLKDEYGEL